MQEVEPLESQVKRLAQFITDNVPGEPSRSEGAIDTALRLLTRHYGPTRPDAGAIQRAVDEATTNPGKTVQARDEESA